MLGKILDARADGIRSELEEARSLHEEAKALLASYEKKQAEVQAQADRIVEAARVEAATAAEQAKADIKKSVARRMVAAEEQIASAEASAIKDVRDEAIIVAVAAARDIIENQMTAADGNGLIDDAIEQVGLKATLAGHVNCEKSPRCEPWAFFVPRRICAGGNFGRGESQGRSNA